MSLDDDATPHEDDAGPSPESKRLAKARRKLESSAGKLIVIAGISLLFPGLGALTGAFALYSAWWAWGRARDLETPTGVRRALAALALSLVALGLQALWVYLLLES